MVDVKETKCCGNCRFVAIRVSARADLNPNPSPSALCRRNPAEKDYGWPTVRVNDLCEHHQFRSADDDMTMMREWVGKT